MSTDRVEGNAGEEFARARLVKLAVDQVNWLVLYRDPKTGEYWRKSYPQSETHGGGPPLFEKISPKEALEAFGNAAANGGKDEE